MTSPPGTWGVPWLGASLPFVRQPLHWMQQQAARYGPIFKTTLIGRPTVFLLGPAANEWVLSTHAAALHWREGYGDAAFRLFGPALFLQDGAPHDQARAVMAPAFRGERMRHCFAQIHEVVDDQLAGWPVAQPFELYRAAKHLAFRLAARVLMDVDSDPQTPQLCRLFDQFAAGLFTPFTLDVPATLFGRALRAQRALVAYFADVLVQRRQRPGDDVLGLMLASGMSDDAIISHLLLLLFAGHDTTASLLTWLCYELSRQPGLVARLRHELHQVVGDQPLTLAHLRELPLLDAVVREGERLHPPAPTGFRGLQATLEFGGYTLPKGWIVVYAPIFTHHMPSLWADPTRFDPDRMLAPRSEHRRVPYSLVGFGGGPRKCIGEGLAQLELKTILATLLAQHDLVLQPRQRIVPVFTPSLHPAHGLWLTRQPRSN